MCRWQAVHPARPPGCQGNVTSAARALNPCQDPARAGRRRQNFQTICWAIPGVSLSIIWPLPPGLLLSMNFHGKKVGRLCYMFLRPAALRVVAVGRLWLAWLAPGLQGDPVCLPCALLRFVGPQCSSRPVTRHVSHGQTPIPALLDASALVPRPGELHSYGLRTMSLRARSFVVVVKLTVFNLVKHTSQNLAS